MSKHTVKYPSPVGPIATEVTDCDECGNRTQSELMMGWLAMGYQGTPVPTMGSQPDNLDFCSLDCLTRAVSQMQG